VIATAARAEAQLKPILAVAAAKPSPAASRSAVAHPAGASAQKGGTHTKAAGNKPAARKPS
jgi:hypothetical protein